MTREEWLNAVADALRPMFAAAGAPIPNKVRMTVGWPSRRALGKGKRTIGQCWDPSASADQTAEIFVSPCLGDPIEAASTLAHELIHAAVGNKEGHKGAFKRVALALGFLPPMTSTPMGATLIEALTRILETVGPYPHATLDASNAKKQGTRMLKATCPTDGYTVRLTRKWADVGMPLCPCGCELELTEADSDD